LISCEKKEKHARLLQKLISCCRSTLSIWY